MTKDETIELIKNSDNLIIRYDKKWRYPKIGDDQRTCPLLDFMFNIEYKSGYLIFIPDTENQFGKVGNANRNQEEG
jgi:hypothetical protein